MHRSTRQLLRMLARHAVTAVAIAGLLLSGLCLPCLAAGHDDLAPLAAVPAAAVGDASGASGAEACGHCHCAALAFSALADAVAWMPLRGDDARDGQRPASSRVPDGLVRTPDVPPDKV